MAYLMMFSAAVTFIIGLKQKSKILRIILLLVFCSFLADFIFRTASFFRIYISETGPIFRLVELLLLIEFYCVLLGIKKHLVLIRLVQLTSIFIFVLVVGLNPTPMRITNNIIFSILPTIYFVKMIIEMKVENPINFPLFWVNSAFLAYFSGSLFFSLFLEPLVKISEMSAILSYAYHNALGLTKNILIGIAFWISYKNPSWQKNLAL